MNDRTLAFPSYTYAVKAARLLRSHGIACEMRRTEDVSRSGCGWELLLRTDLSRATALLRHSRIPFSGAPSPDDRP